MLHLWIMERILYLVPSCRVWPGGFTERNSCRSTNKINHKCKSKHVIELYLQAQIGKKIIKYLAGISEGHWIGVLNKHFKQPFSTVLQVSLLIIKFLRRLSHLPVTFKALWKSNSLVQISIGLLYISKTALFFLEERRWHPSGVHNLLTAMYV